jgi:hypothetical protein
LGAAQLLDAWFSLGIETLTTSLVWREVNRRSQKAKMRQFARDERMQIVAVGLFVLSPFRNAGLVLHQAVGKSFPSNPCQVRAPPSERQRTGCSASPTLES